MRHTGPSSLTILLILLAAALLLGSLACTAGEECEVSYGDALLKMQRLANRIDQVAIKTTQSIVKANHWHQMVSQARIADKDVERLIRNAARLIEGASRLGIAFYTFDIEVYNDEVGQWISFDPIHLLSSGD